ncbi:MAG: protein kinase [Elusimicrobiota bacterium]
MTIAGLCLLTLVSMAGLSPAIAQRHPGGGGESLRDLTDDQLREKMKEMQEKGPQMLERMKQDDPAMYEKYAPMIQQMQDVYKNVDSPEDMRAFLGFMQSMGGVSRAFHDDNPANDARAEERFQQATARMIDLKLLTPENAQAMLQFARATEFGHRPGGHGGPDGGGNKPFPPGILDQIRDQAGNNPWLQKEAAKSALTYGDPASAVSEAMKAVQMGPKDPEAHLTLAQAQLRAGDKKAAYESAVSALRLDPGNTEALSIAKLNAGRGGSPPPAPGSETPKGTRFFSSSGDRLDPTFFAPNPRVSVNKQVEHARMLIKAKDYEEAAKAAARAVQLDPKNLEARFTLLHALMNAKRLPEALTAANDALALAPRDSRLLASRARIHNLMKNHKLALLDAEDAIAVDAGNPEAWMQKGWALDGMRVRREEKLAAFAKAAELDASYRTVYEMARSLQDGELALVLAGEKRPAAHGKPSGARKLTVFGLSSLVGGLMIALGLLQFGGRELQTKAKRFVAALRENSPKVEEPGPAAAGPGLSGSYQVVRRIGAGGMGEVYEALDTALNRRVAIKKLRDEIRSSPRERERFLRMAKTVAALHHPNIVDIYSVLEDGPDAYLVFEFVDGKTVDELLRSRGRLSLNDALGVASGVVAAIEYAQSKGVLHGGLKPSNIMIGRDRVVKVMDFGLAQEAKEFMGGSTPYTAPEQGQGMSCRASDVYSLAACLYEMLSGRPPSEGNGAGPLSACVDGLPTGLDAVLARGLDPEPAKRWPSTAELYSALKSLNGKR